MSLSSFVRLVGIAVLSTLSVANQTTPTHQVLVPVSKFPFPERLSYRVEWRLITAGTAEVDHKQTGSGVWETDIKIESAGVLTRLYRVLDNYKVLTDAHFCAVDSLLDAQEGKRHLITHIVFDKARQKARTEERDLIKKTTAQRDLDTRACTHEIAGALYSLRAMNLEPGKMVSIPVTDGKKFVSARIEGQTRENVTIEGKTYPTVRYEAYLFDNVLYRRKGRLFIWVAEGGDRLPVQLRLQLGFPIGNVTVQLEKEEKL